MKYASVALLAALSGSTLFAQNPTWAEQLHKTKTGAWPPGVEQRLKEEKRARERLSQPKLNEIFALLDHDGNGQITAEEWKRLTQPGAQPPSTKD